MWYMDGDKLKKLHSLISWPSPFKDVMANVLMSNCLLTHPAAVEQHEHSFGTVILATCMLCFGLHQLLKEKSGSLAAKCSFTSYSLTVSVCCSVLSRLWTVGLSELFFFCLFFA